MSNIMQISKSQKGKRSMLVNAKIINISSGGGENKRSEQYEYQNLIRENKVRDYY
jgi:hypothetical protein